MKETRFKETEIGRIPEDWEIDVIGSITKVTSGGTPSTSEPSYWGGNIPWMNSGELNLKIVSEVEGRITENGLNCSSTKWIPKECVLIGLAGQGKTRGTAAYNTIPLCINQSIGAIFPSKIVVNKFLYYYMNTLYNFLRKISDGGGGRGGLTKNLLEGIVIPIPSKEEQSRIASALTSIDNLISSLDKLIEKKKNIKQGTMQQLLTGKKRLNGFNEPWVEKKLGELCSIYKGQQVNGDRLLESGLYAMLNGGIEPSGYIVEFNTEGNSITISEGGNSCGYVSYMKKRFWAGAHCYVLMLKDAIHTKYLYYLLKLYEEKIMSLRVGSGLPNIQRKALLDFKLLDTENYEEQTVIASILTSMDNAIAALEAKKAKYEQIKQGMMQQLLTGKIRLV